LVCGIRFDSKMNCSLRRMQWSVSGTAERFKFRWCSSFHAPSPMECICYRWLSPTQQPDVMTTERRKTWSPCSRNRTLHLLLSGQLYFHYTRKSLYSPSYNGMRILSIRIKIGVFIRWIRIGCLPHLERGLVVQSLAIGLNMQ